jgi:membrane protein YdbS with pleckstrin-like domain
MRGKEEEEIDDKKIDSCLDMSAMYLCRLFITNFRCFFSCFSFTLVFHAVAVVVVVVVVVVVIVDGSGSDSDDYHDIVPCTMIKMF